MTPRLSLTAGLLTFHPVRESFLRYHLSVQHLGQWPSRLVTQQRRDPLIATKSAQDFSIFPAPSGPQAYRKPD
jgi:hypothetical protein